MLMYRDDQFITDDGYLPMPPDYLPIMSGYIYHCKLYRRRFNSRICS